MIDLILVLFNFALNVADSLLTNRVLEQGGTERNPVIQLLMSEILNPWRWMFKLTVAVGVSWLIYANMEGWMRTLMLTLWCLPFVWVCIHNYRQLKD